MANAITYRIDPNILGANALVGNAELPANPNATLWPKLLALANQGLTAFQTVDTTATSLDLAVYESQLQVTGTMAFTLPNGSYVGQLKLVSCTVAASIPAGTLTVTTPDATAGFVCPATFIFNAVGQSRLFEWTGTAWRCIGGVRKGGTANNVVVGTTVLTGLNNWDIYYCSVTGTVASTIAASRGIPNGAFIGEQCSVKVSTAASIPSGTIEFAGLTNAGAAATTLGTMAATTNYARLVWDGAAWNVVGNTTLVAS